MIKRAKILLLAGLFIGSMLTGCSYKTEKRIVIWTDNSEFAPYIELFNETHKTKAVLVYKENPAQSLPPQNGELQPDIVAGPWLRNDKTKKHFQNIDYLFDRKYVSSRDFYPVLLNAGVIRHRQYLLPVSFNLPLIIFSKENENLVEDKYTLTLDQIKSAGADFNKTDKNGKYTKMGFAPQSSDDFLYLYAKVSGADFKEAKNSSFSYNANQLSKIIQNLSLWIDEKNGSSKTEQDFVYKYLSETDDKRVTSGRTLFSYTTSDRLFKYSSNQFSKIDYRWIQVDKTIPVEDSMNMLGITKYAENISGACEFISWFYKTETQQVFLERSFAMHLENTKFGIADGFSAIKEVNEHIMPVYYTSLLSNIPQAGTFKIYDKKPAQWEKIKHAVIIPYIKEMLSENNEKKISTIEERYSDWKKSGLN